MARTRKNSVASVVIPPTVWTSLNEPVMEITEKMAETVFLVTAVIMLSAWVAPYWGKTPAQIAAHYSGMDVVSEQVAGVTTYGTQEVVFSNAIPDWYQQAASNAVSVSEAIAASADQILDISEPVGQAVEYYQPGVSAVWNAWLDLMADP